MVCLVSGLLCFLSLLFLHRHVLNVTLALLREIDPEM